MKSHIDKSGRAALLCWACRDRLDDPVLLQCGHIFCFECIEQSISCVAQGCHEKSVPFTDISSQMNAIDAILGYSPIGSAPNYDSDQDSDVVYLGSTVPQSLQQTHLRDESKVKPDPEVIEIDSDSEDDDGFDNRSQRSVSYRDDGNGSFIADDASSIGGDYEVNTEVEIPQGMSLIEYDDMIDSEEIPKGECWQQELEEEIKDLF